MAKLSKTAYPPYYDHYIQLAPTGQLLEILKIQKKEMLEFLNNIDELSAGYRYAEEKWSIKEIVGHLNDVERIFCYRALCFARNDQTALPGFDEEAYVRAARFDKQTWSDLQHQFKLNRRTSISLFSSLNENELKRFGTANGVQFRVLAIPYIITGHARHHQQIIQERYLDA